MVRHKQNYENSNNFRSIRNRDNCFHKNYRNFKSRFNIRNNFDGGNYK